MIYLLFSTQSSGSTYVQREVARYIDVPRPVGQEISDAELSLLDWGAHFVYAPKETIDFEPGRTYDPQTGKEVSLWRKNYRDYLGHSAHLIGRDFWDLSAENWITVQQFFLEQVIAPLSSKYDLPIYSELRYNSRLDYVTEVFRRLSDKGPVFGKNPKWLNDFSGHTEQLLQNLLSSGVPIKGIYLYRCPANTHASILERKFRLEEMFKGDIHAYDDFTYDALCFSINLGTSLSQEYEFLRIKYEDLSNDMSRLFCYLNITSTPDTSGYQKKYSHRYILNPRSRRRFNELKQLGNILGYSNTYYPKRITFIRYVSELLVTLIRTSTRHTGNVNNPETARSILKKCFWYEVHNPKVRYLKRIYHLIVRR